jgi:azurin
MVWPGPLKRGPARKDKDIMKRVSIVSFLIVAAVLAAQSFVPAQAKPRTIEIEGTDAMKFSVVSIEAKPGEQLRVVLKAVGKMPKMAMSHNFVLLGAGVNAMDFANKSVMAAATNYIAPELKGQVLASTALAGAGETVEVTFKAPAKAGAYTFICSFPGHFAAGMRGTLVVK